MMISIHLPNQFLQSDEYFYNAIHAFYHAKIEHTNAIFDKHIFIYTFYYENTLIFL